jgi:hypothetical protein
LEESAYGFGGLEPLFSLNLDAKGWLE